MALGDIYNIDTSIGSPSKPRLGGNTESQNMIQKDLARLGESPRRVKEEDRENVFEAGVDQMQKMLYAGADVGGGLLRKHGIAEGIGQDLQEFGMEGVAQQEKDLKEGGWTPTYQGGLADQDNVLDKIGWVAENSALNAPQLVAGVAGMGAAALTAAVSAPAAAAIAGGTALMGGVAMAGETAEEMREKGVDVDYDLAGGVGLVGGILDTIGVGKVLPKSMLAKLTGKQIAKVVEQKAGKEMALEFSKQFLKKALPEAATEAIQEGLIIGAAGLAEAKYTHDEVVERLVEGAVVGGALGGTVGAPLEMASGKFGGAATKATPEPETGTDPLEETVKEAEKPGQGPRQLSLFDDGHLPEYATRTEKGDIEVVNPVTTAPVVNKKLEVPLKLIAALEARKALEPQRADRLNRAIRNHINRIEKTLGQTPQTEDTKVTDDWLEATDIVDYYRDKLNKETKSTTAKAKRADAKAETKVKGPEVEVPPVAPETKVEEQVAAPPVVEEPVDLDAVLKESRAKLIREAAERVRQQAEEPAVPVQEPVAEVEAPVSPEVQPTRIENNFSPETPMSGTLHTLRNASDLESVIEDGLKSGTNVGNSQSQAVGGGITLEYDPQDIDVTAKGYNPGEGTINKGEALPTRILVDTSDLGLKPGIPTVETTEKSMTDFYNESVKEEGGVSPEEFFGDVGGVLDAMVNPSRGAGAKFDRETIAEFKKKYGSHITKKVRTNSREWEAGMSNVGEAVEGETEEGYIQNIVDQAQGVPVYTYQVDENGQHMNVQPVTTPAPDVVAPEGDTFGSFAAREYGLDVAQIDSWTPADKSKVAQAWTEQNEMKPTEDSGMRTIDTVGVVPQKSKPKKEPKSRKKTYRQETSIPEGSVMGKDGTPYNNARIAGTQLARKGLKESHEVVQLGDGLYVLAPKAKNVPGSEESARAPTAASPELQAVLEQGEETGNAAPVNLAVEDADDGVSIDQAHELQSRWTSFMDGPKGTSDHAKKWSGVVQKFLDEQGIQMSSVAFREADWSSENGQAIYKALVNTLAGRKMGASVLAANQTNKLVLSDKAAKGMADVQNTLTIEEKATAAALTVQLQETEEAYTPPAAEKKPSKGGTSKSALMRKSKADLIKARNELKGKPTASAELVAIVKKTKAELVQEIMDAGGIKKAVKAPKAKPTKVEETGQLDEDTPFEVLDDRDMQVLEQEAARLAQEAPEVQKEEVVDTRTVDLKKERNRINAELSDYKEQGYTDEDEEVAALKEQRRDIFNELKALGATKTAKPRVKMTDTPGEIPMESHAPGVPSDVSQKIDEYDNSYLSERVYAASKEGTAAQKKAAYAQAEQDMLEHDPVFLRGKDDITWLNNQNIPGFEEWTTTGWVEGPEKIGEGTHMVEVQWTSNDGAYPITTWVEADASLGLDPEVIKAAALRAAARAEYQGGLEKSTSSIKHYPLMKKANNSLEHYEMVKGVFDDFVSRINAPDVDIILLASANELPSKRRDGHFQRNGGKSTSRGLYFPKGEFNNRPTIYIMADRLSNAATTADVLLHELVGHHGFRALFGDKWDGFMRKSLQNTPDLFQKAYDETEIAGRNPWGFDVSEADGRAADAINQRVIEVVVDGKLRKVREETAIKVLDEYLAITAQSFNTKDWINIHKSRKGWYMRAKAWLKHNILSFNKGNKYKFKLSDTDIQGMLSEYAARIEKGGTLTTAKKKMGGYTADALEALTLDERTKSGKDNPLYIHPSEEAEYVSTIPESEIMVGNELQGVRESQVTATEELMADDSFGELNKAYFRGKYNQISDSLQNRFPKATRWFNPTAVLSSPKQERALHNKTLGNIDRASRRANVAAKTLKGLSKIQNAQIHAYMKDPKGDHTKLHTLDREVQNSVFAYKQSIKEMGQQLVNLGVLDQATYDKNKGAYLHVSYLKYRATEYHGAGKRLSPLDYLKQKDPNLSADDKLRLGKMEKEMDVVIPEMLGLIGRDVALLEYTKNLKAFNDANPGTNWVLPNSYITLNDGRTVSMFELSRDIERWKEQLAGGPDASNTEADLARLQAHVQEGQTKLAQKEGELKTTVDEDKALHEQYKRLPLKQEYGSLAGEYVMKPLFDDMTDGVMGYSPSGHNNAIEAFFGSDMVLNKMHMLWKQMKVPMNPASWFRNGVGNFVLLDIATSTNSAKLLKMVSDEFTNMVTGKSSVWRERAIDRGAFGSTFSNQELHAQREAYQRTVDKNIRDRLVAEEGKNALADAGMGGMRGMIRLVNEFKDYGGELYGNLEGVFKTVAMRDHVQRWEKQTGQKFEQLGTEQQEQVLDAAIAQANEAIFDYSEVPQWLRLGRRSIVGAPFLTYTYKAFPASLRGMASNPQKFIKYAMLPYMLSAAAMAAGNIDEDELEEFQKRAPEWMQKKSSVYVLPWKDDNGNLQAMDFGYFFPWAPWMDLYKATNANWRTEEPVMSIGKSGWNAAAHLGFLGGPFPSMILGGIGNKDVFLDRPIRTPGATESQQMTEFMSWLWTLWTPPFMGSSGILNKLADQYDIHPISAATGGFIQENDRSINRQGNERSTVGQDIGRGFGMTTYSVDTQQTHRGNILGFNQEEREIKVAKGRALRNMNQTPAQRQAVAKEYNQKLQRLRERRASYVKGGF